MEKLIFVYNANSGKLNGLMGSLHKVVSPSTYTCKLCELTYNTFGENKVWRDFRENMDIDVDFFHKDEFLKSYASKFGHKFEFPVVLAQAEKGLEVFISKNEFSEIDDLEVLMNTIIERSKLY